jgi:N-methylhydantoinase A
VPRIIGVDVGGTFTDVAIHDGDRLIGYKVPTTSDQSVGVASSVDWEEEDLFLHGTTVATNCLLQERGARVALVTDSGFEDLIEIARQDRPSLYDPTVDRPAPLTPRNLRLGHSGDVGDTIRQLLEIDPEYVVVGMLDAYQEPEGEMALAQALGAGLPVPVLGATMVSPEFREYERLATGLLSAYLTPSVSGYLEALTEIVPARRRLVMTSAGGLIPFDHGAADAARLVLSGPAGGVVAAAALGEAHGHQTVISFDMGGTSTDVCRITNGRPFVGSGHRVAGRENRVPSVAVHTIGAGGGSLGWADPGGALRVGPQSAGAVPGPAAYGIGGQTATVTDANLALGHIPPTLSLGGSMAMDVSLALGALGRLGSETGMEPLAVARGMLDVVDSHMEHAIRAVSVEEGIDPRQTTLVAFGGAGGLHATRLARALKIPMVLIPPFSGVFSALGLLLATPRADAARTVMCAELDDNLRGHAESVMNQVRGHYLALYDTPSVDARFGFDCRYVGQSHELEVEAPPDWTAIRQAFEQTHLRHFGFTRPAEPIEVVNVRAAAWGQPPLRWDTVQASPPVGSPNASEGAWMRNSLPPGYRLSGPAVIVEDTSATLLEPGDQMTVLDDGTLEIVVG